MTGVLITIGTVGAAIGAFMVACRLLLKIWRFIAKISLFLEVTAPVIMDIAEEFKANSGSTLKDQITALQCQAVEAKQFAEQAVNARTAQEERLTKLGETMATQFLAVRRSLHQLKKKADFKNLK